MLSKARETGTGHSLAKRLIAHSSCSSLGIIRVGRMTNSMKQPLSVLPTARSTARPEHWFVWFRPPPSSPDQY